MNWSFFNILWIVVGGAIVGIVARLVMPGHQKMPFWTVIVAGIVGMFAGDALAGLLGVKETGGYDWIRHGLQIVTAIVAVAIGSKIFGGKSGGTTN